MAKPSLPSVDLAELSEKLQRQFHGLDPKDPSQWPALPRVLVYAFVALVVIGAAWYVWLSDFQAELDTAAAQEITLRQDYQTKLTKAINLQALKTQREQIRVFVNQLEKQLPSKAEMDALLSDINQAGLGRSLQFELFRPGNVQVRDYYAELPIQVRVTGRYHDMGDFTADVAHLSRIVTLDNLSITPAKDGQLAMDVTARTFRYLDPEEIEAQRKAAAGAKK
ncbi:type 4a pilus biogenesis protein PilO [Xylophilus sp. GOD-11R]|uniref:type 4a pilus biogenesis protein PilO n=1 Tax=Xylophilus sp. GOD-11R TaxID=3089814 RepID=UPI00298D3D0A|nr:type 4a pilus biogenesis protein PilO [Xylophilus sp. GOD-11R]WPB57578.1 type 4a pilus biogenesis protein PilO [Xylophilus sp. GOD-11R]